MSVVVSVVIAMRWLFLRSDGVAVVGVAVGLLYSFIVVDTAVVLLL